MKTRKHQLNNTHTQGLQFIGNYNLKLLQQIFPIDSNDNLPCDNDFLYWIFGDYDLKMSKWLTFP